MTYYIDQELVEEMSRLLTQDGLFTEAVGGLLPELPGFEGINSILDIACGPGRWATEAAKACPGSKVVGVDISKRMIHFAQTRAFDEEVKNVKFEEMNVLKELPQERFNLVNARLIYGFMTIYLWPQLIQRCFDLLTPGGFLRITEDDAAVVTNSPALTEYYRLGAHALYKNKQGFYKHRSGIIPRLKGWYNDAGFHQVGQRHSIIDISYGSKFHIPAFEDLRSVLQLLQTFIVRMNVSTNEEIERLYREVLEEMTQPEFVGFWHLSTVFGQKPE